MHHGSPRLTGGPIEMEWYPSAGVQSAYSTALADFARYKKELINGCMKYVCCVFPGGNFYVKCNIKETRKTVQVMNKEV